MNTLDFFLVDPLLSLELKGMVAGPCLHVIDEYIIYFLLPRCISLSISLSVFLNFFSSAK